MAIPSLYVPDIRDMGLTYFVIVDGVVSMNITEDVINQTFDAYLNAFNILAAQEDVLEGMRSELGDYKEGGSKYTEAQNKIAAFERTLVEHQRNLRKAALQLDRIKTLVSVQRYCIGV